MTTDAVTFFLYLLQYLLARLLCKRLLRPLTGSGFAAAVLESLAISGLLLLAARLLRRRARRR